MIKHICVQLKHKEMEMRINDFHQMFYQFGACVWQWVDLFPLNVCVYGYGVWETTFDMDYTLRTNSARQELMIVIRTVQEFILSTLSIWSYSGILNKLYFQYWKKETERVI